MISKATWEWVLIGLGVIFYLLLFPHGIYGDASVRYANVLSFVRTGHLEPMVYSYVHPLISSPLLLLGHVIKDEYWWMSRFNTFVFFGTLTVMARHFRAEWEPASVRLFLLLMLCGTMFPAHVTDYYSEVFSACMAAIAILQFQKGRGGLAILLGCLSAWNTPGTALACAGMFTIFALESRRLRYWGGLALIFGGIMLENHLKYGEFFPTAYLHMQGAKTLLPYSGGPGFNYPILFGLISVLFSSGKGLIFFTPGIIALFNPAVWRSQDSTSGFLRAGVAYFIGLLLVFSRWWCWTGAWFWGPRFYLFVSILALMPLIAIYRDRTASLPWRVYWFFAVLLSLWVGCEGILYGQDFLEDCYAKTQGVDFMCYYVPEYSVLWRFFIVWPVVKGRKVAYLIYFLLVMATVLIPPGLALLREAWAGARKFWARFGPQAPWKL